MNAWFVKIKAFKIQKIHPETKKFIRSSYQFANLYASIINIRKNRFQRFFKQYTSPSSRYTEHSHLLKDVKYIFNARMFPALSLVENSRKHFGH